MGTCNDDLKECFCSSMIVFPCACLGFILILLTATIYLSSACIDISQLNLL